MTKYIKITKDLDKRRSTAMAERLDEHEKSIRALALAKEQERRYKNRLIKKQISTGYIYALPGSMVRFQTELEYLFN